MYVQKYKLWNMSEKAGTPRADLARRAMEEMHAFYATSPGTASLPEGERGASRHIARGGHEHNAVDP